MNQVPRPDAWRHRLGPERVAAVVSLVIVLGGVAVASTVGSSDGLDSRPTRAPGGVAAAVATPHPFLSIATLSLLMHERLAAERAALAEELSTSDFDSAAVVSAVRRLNSTNNVAAQMATALTEVRGSRDVGRALGAFYSAVAGAADTVLDFQVRDEVAVRDAAERLLLALEPTDALLRRLEVLIASARATPNVAVIPTATPAPSEPAVEPTPTAGVSATPTPVAPTPTPTVAPTAPPSPVRPTGLPLLGLVRNPGFEAADPSPWILFVESPATAALTMDSVAPYEGARSARIDVVTPSSTRAGVSLRQTGIAVAQGHRYSCRIVLRSAAPGEVRVRVTSTSGTTYGSRPVTVGPDWTVAEFQFGSFVGDPAAVIQIDLGLSATTTWVDAAQITDVSAFAP